MRQFASITADILARKGEARPWDSVGASGETKRSLSWESPPKPRPPVQQSVAEPPPALANLQNLLAEQIDQIHERLAEPTVPPPRIRHARMEPIAPPPKISPVAAEPIAPILQRALADEIAPGLHEPAPDAAPAKPNRALMEEIHHPDSHAPDDMRKCTVKISHHDYERLGILAVKQGKSRQRLLQETVNSLFTGMTEEYGNSCHCLGKCG